MSKFIAINQTAPPGSIRVIGMFVQQEYKQFLPDSFWSDKNRQIKEDPSLLISKDKEETEYQ